MLEVSRYVTIVTPLIRDAIEQLKPIPVTGGTILILLVYRDPDGIKTYSVGTNRRKWQAVSTNVVLYLISWKQRNGIARHIWYRMMQDFFPSTHTHKCMELKVDFDVFVRSQDCGIIFHTQICQRAHKLLWSIDGKPEKGLISPVWHHCWYDDSVGTWQRILLVICTHLDKSSLTFVSGTNL